MKIAGIVCEYNPLHRGHLYQIEKTAEILGRDAAIVCVMSGNFVQRGESAIFDKYVRALAALREGEADAGADLVLELPVTAAVHSAEGFAMGAVGVLDRLGVVEALSFGSECGDTAALASAADVLERSDFSEKLKPFLDAGLPYAKARHLAAAAMDEGAARVLGKPNDILGVEYIKALRALRSKMTPIAVSRVGAAHDGSRAQGGFASASGIRGLMLAGDQSWKQYVPERAAALFEREMSEKRGPCALAFAERAVLHALRTMKEEDYVRLPFGSEGLCNRFRRYAATGASISEIVDGVKTKRYAHARVRRMLLCAYLGITTEDLTLASPYVRVLAFNDRGREIIKAVRQQGGIPLLQHGKHAQRLGEDAKRYFDLECRCADLFSLCGPPGSVCKTRAEWEKGSLYLRKKGLEISKAIC